MCKNGQKWAKVGEKCNDARAFPRGLLPWRACRCVAHLQMVHAFACRCAAPLQVSHDFEGDASLVLAQKELKKLNAFKVCVRYCHRVGLQ